MLLHFLRHVSPEEMVAAMGGIWLGPKPPNAARETGLLGAR